jgi:hypothetical protein
MGLPEILKSNWQFLFHILIFDRQPKLENNKQKTTEHFHLWFIIWKYNVLIKKMKCIPVETTALFPNMSVLSSGKIPLIDEMSFSQTLGRWWKMRSSPQRNKV